MPSPTSATTSAQIEPSRGIRTAQIICVAMLSAVVTFACIVLVSQGPARDPSIASIALLFSAVQIVASFVVPGLIIRGQMQKLVGTEPASLNSYLFPIFQTKMIIGLALLEGAAIFNLIAYMFERQWWSLAATGVLLLLMAVKFPTLRQFENWAEDFKRDLENRF